MDNDSTRMEKVICINEERYNKVSEIVRSTIEETLISYRCESRPDARR